MKHWFTRADAVETRPLKRFDPRHWTIDFPRGTIASLRQGEDAHALVVEAEYLREGDLVGLIWTSEDRASHRAHARRTARDYAGTRLSFRWQSQGLMPLDAVNGPTLTIEGRDENGQERSWWVRLWNYAQGAPEDAVVTLDFDQLDAGFSLPGDAERVFVGAIDRMFISLVPPDYVAASATIRSAPAAARVTVSAIECRGRGSVIAAGSSWQPANPYAVCTAYDDLYHLPPARLFDTIERLGHRRTITHYVGMSHYMALAGDGRVDATRTMNQPALAWHRAFAAEAAARGFSLIWSLSYEILDMFCPEAWKQRDADGNPALTGWAPPSSLVSPANAEGIAYLARIAETLVELSREAGLAPRFQIGEPWWWISASGQPCLYDADAVAAFGGAPPVIESVRTASLGADEKALLDAAGSLLSQSTATIGAAARGVDPSTELLLLAFLPSILDEQAPEVRRANLPTGWAAPAFDRLQVEDYDWVTARVPTARRETAMAAIDARLGYPREEQHYFAGFATDPAAARTQWPAIIAAADHAARAGYADIFIWALPQLMRDSLVLFAEETDVDAFADLAFPIAIGADASVAPTFSTQLVTSASGHEYRNANWACARLHFDAGPGIRGDAEMETLLSFFRARRGAAQAFRFRDPFDHSSHAMTGVPQADDQPIGTGDGARDRFQLVKAYGGGETRTITRPEAGSVRIALDGIEQVGGWTLEAMGVVRFETPPQAGAHVTAGFRFDVPVRFASDRLDVNRASFLAGEAPSVPLIEVREEGGA